MSETEVRGIIILVLGVKRGLIQGRFRYISPRNMHDALLRVGGGEALFRVGTGSDGDVGRLGTLMLLHFFAEEEDEFLS